MDIDIAQVMDILLRLGSAYILALPVAWNRDKGSHRNAGLRTFPLVALASCGYMLVGIQVLNSTNAESRVLYGIITGMGFIGGGAILKNDSGVTGTATAASLWVTGAIGIATAFSRFEIAICLSVATYLTLKFVPFLKNDSPRDD